MSTPNYEIKRDGSRWAIVPVAVQPGIVEHYARDSLTMDARHASEAAPRVQGEAITDKPVPYLRVGTYLPVSDGAA